MKRKHEFLELYRTEKGTVYIDISLSYYREIYNEWDFSPVRNRDLDDDLLEYLEECYNEIPSKFRTILSINLPPEIRDKRKEELSSNSIMNFFKYRMRKIRTERKNAFFQSFKYGITGILLLTAANLSKYLFGDEVLSKALISEGLFIGGWVLFWEMFSVYFFQVGEFNRKINIYSRLLKTEIEYRYN